MNFFLTLWVSLKYFLEIFGRNRVMTWNDSFLSKLFAQAFWNRMLNQKVTCCRSQQDALFGNLLMKRNETAKLSKWGPFSFLFSKSLRKNNKINRLSNQFILPKCFFRKSHALDLWTRREVRTPGSRNRSDVFPEEITFSRPGEIPWKWWSQIRVLHPGKTRAASS